ncbi:hypothetical protein PCC7424_5813 (plasmid) [Gloeothece citriformis PCC 7424]|uniref:Uncharacterized protein n=1 Tax=Gloeothece citriformis (strain PCC 7424) TaxID=65393 RepID=B7KM52_GLOC7|nr:hypothetical protein [Gloeothece citriformis]ACK73874.1 hypothetical protein PCC7424_5813 [Gloeothece citriformis PCC 7424]
MATELNTFTFTPFHDLAQDLDSGLANTGNFINRPLAKVFRDIIKGYSFFEFAREQL